MVYCSFSLEPYYFWASKPETCVEVGEGVIGYCYKMNLGTGRSCPRNTPSMET